MILAERSTPYSPKNGPAFSGSLNQFSFPKHSATTWFLSSAGQPDDEAMSASLWSVSLPLNPWPSPDFQQIIPDIPNIPDVVNPDHYIRIRSPRRRPVANEITVTLRKNKRFAALVELSYVRLDWVWEVPFAILLVVPRTGMQLMLRAISMEKIMRIYAKWGWDQAWGQTYRSLPENLQGVGYCQDHDDLGPPENIKQGGGAEYPEVARQPCRILDSPASSRTVEQDGDAEDEARAGSSSTGSWDSAHRPDDEVNGRSEEKISPCAQQVMVYAGEAHCVALAKLLQEAQ